LSHAVPPAPPPTATTDTDVSPDGTTNVYVPAVVYDVELGAIYAISLLALLAAPVPCEFVAVTVNV
jgi:hypothetical protein